MIELQYSVVVKVCGSCKVFDAFNFFSGCFIDNEKFNLKSNSLFTLPPGTAPFGDDTFHYQVDNFLNVMFVFLPFDKL